MQISRTLTNNLLNLSRGTKISWLVSKKRSFIPESIKNYSNNTIILVILDLTMSPISCISAVFSVSSVCNLCHLYHQLRECQLWLFSILNHCVHFGHCFHSYECSETYKKNLSISTFSVLANISSFFKKICDLIAIFNSTPFLLCSPVFIPHHSSLFGIKAKFIGIGSAMIHNLLNMRWDQIFDETRRPIDPYWNVLMRIYILEATWPAMGLAWAVSKDIEKGSFLTYYNMGMKLRVRFQRCKFVF